MAREYTEIVFEENCPNARTLAKSIAEEKIKSILEGELKVLSEKFRTYEAAPEIVSRSLEEVAKKATKRRGSNKPKPTIEKGDSQPVEIGLKAGDAVILDSETFPWLKEDSIVNVLHVECGGDGTAVAVVDARTEEAKKVEHKMTGYENDEKKRDILPIIKDKLTMAAKYVATSDSGLRDSWTTLRYRDKNKYPFSIFSWKIQTPDALRMYVSHIAADKVDDESVREILKDNGITHLLMLLGACDKNNQEELLPVFTGRTRRIEAADGAGA